jgi:hypothetical protein
MTKRIVPLFALIGVIAFGEVPAVTVSNPVEINIGFFPNRAGKLCSMLCISKHGDRLAPILLWVPESGEGSIELRDVASLGEVLRLEVQGLGANADHDDVIQFIAAFLGKFVGSSNDVLLLLEPDRSNYLAKLRRVLSAADYEETDRAFDVPKASVNGENWTLYFLLRTKRMGLELRRFRGTFKPFTITEVETSVRLPNGFIPKTLFAPGMGDRLEH